MRTTRRRRRAVVPGLQRSWQAGCRGRAQLPLEAVRRGSHARAARVLRRRERPGLRQVAAVPGLPRRDPAGGVPRGLRPGATRVRVSFGVVFNPLIPLFPNSLPKTSAISAVICFKEIFL